MQIIRGLDFQLKNSSVSLGKFDGIHKGHRYLLSNVKKRDDLIATAFTFDLGGIPKIYTQKEKDAVLERLGIEREIIFPFQEETKNISAEAFIQSILVEKMDARYICVGEDFRFGKNREGDVRLLKEWQKKYGFELEITAKLKEQGEIISSTRIRKLLQSGELDAANKLLGGEYFICGTVLTGESFGRKIESPTANLSVEKDKILPKFGVYATITRVDEKKYFGVTNVGVKPTAGEFPAGVETNLFGFHGDLYGKQICVNFCEFLREEKRFSSMDDLKYQIALDKERAGNYLQNYYQKYKIEI